MKELKTCCIWNSILRAIVFICITAAAFYFHKPSLLWWYIIPACMGISYSDDKESEDTE